MSWFICLAKTDRFKPALTSDVSTMRLLMDKLECFLKIVVLSTIIFTTAIFMFGNQFAKISIEKSLITALLLGVGNGVIFLIKDRG